MTPATSWPGLSRPSRFERCSASRIGITGTRLVMTWKGELHPFTIQPHEPALHCATRKSLPKRSCSSKTPAANPSKTNLTDACSFRGPDLYRRDLPGGRASDRGRENRGAGLCDLVRRQCGHGRLRLREAGAATRSPDLDRG